MTKEDAIKFGCYDRYHPEGKTPLKYDEFKEYEVKVVTNWWDQLHRVFRFPNGLGASVIKNYGSCGFEKDLFELAVIQWTNNEDYKLCYTTEITNNVLGYLTNQEVLNYLEKIKELENDNKN